MKQAFKAALIAAACALGAIHPTAYAYVNADAVTLTRDPGTFPPGMLGDEEQAFHLHFGSRPADIIVSTDLYRTGLHWITQTLDVYAALKLSTPGEALTQATFAQGVDPGLSPFDNPAAGNDFYLAGMVDTGFLDPGEPSVPSPGMSGDTRHDVRFGWAHIHIDAHSGQATVLASAMAYGEPGIIVGTTQLVPEPGTAALSLLGMGALLWHARRKAGAPASRN